ncbi:hypothetical protein SAMN06265795_101127 [Noviherbaspirillum humi]|uniref:Uncharacterized protein n=1 Tax=Noviherbaspirillum humi TaxID=1688639 RepID=A0A239BXX1_9BURK|nr:hypothetical protein [Noviherbaspirillum humi]SNS12268.1 hypothetical protein SAMN06265795_101127 [Noviherbaspirillum humi]
MADRNEVKALLARAGVEINDAPARMDCMREPGADEVARVAPAACVGKDGSGGSLENALQTMPTQRGGIG